MMIRKLQPAATFKLVDCDTESSGLRGITVFSVRSEQAERRRIHLGLVVAEIICIPAFVIELTRALGGNELSWAYVFEWPLLGAYAIYMWRKLLSDNGEVNQTSANVNNEVPDDPKLQAWNQYLREIHSFETDQRSDER